MLYKKKITCASLLSLGILAGGGFVENSTVAIKETENKQHNLNKW